MITFAVSFNFLEAVAPRVFKPGYALFLVFFLTQIAWGDGLTSTVTKRAIELGERTHVEFHLPISALGLAKYDDESELPVLNDDLIMDSKNILVLERDFTREKDTLIWRFDITSYKKGKAIVPPVEIRFGPHTFSSEAVPLEVVSTRTVEDKALRPDFGASSYPVDWAFWIKLSLFAILAATVAYYLRKYPGWRGWLVRLKQRATMPKIVEEAPESWLRRELMRLKSRLTETGEGRLPLVDDFTRTLRGFFRRKTAKPAESWTTSELKTKLPVGTLPAEIIPLLSRADSWKFSGANSTDGSDAKNDIVKPGIETSERALL